MRAPISVVIPTLNAEKDLPATLCHLMPGLDSGVIRDLVISDGGSSDATLRLAEEAGARIVHGPKGRGGQLQRGVQAAGGDWLLILHADTHLGAGWTDAVQIHLHEHPDCAGFFRLAFRAQGPGPRLVESMANLRAGVLKTPFGDQGLLLSRFLYDAVGGYPDIPLMEDLSLVQALKPHLRRLPATAHTGADRYQQNGWLRQSLNNLHRRARYRRGADPQHLAQAYDAAD